MYLPSNTIFIKLKQIYYYKNFFINTMRVLVFDTETTGLLPPKNEALSKYPFIVQLSWIVYDFGTNKIVSIEDHIVKLPEFIEIPIDLAGKTNQEPKVLTHGHYAPGEPTNEVWGLCTYGDSKRFATVSDDATIRIWDAETHKQISYISLDEDS